MKKEIEADPIPYSPMYGNQKLILESEKQNNQTSSTPKLDPETTMDKNSRTYKIAFGMAIFLFFAFIL